MDTFYPKNFVMWRPQLLLLLIFLEAIYDATGGVSAISSDVGTYCADDSYCQPIHECDQSKNLCVCRNNFKKGSRISNRYNAFYHRKLNKCVSPVGKLCTLRNDGLDPFDCVPYATCVPQPDKHLPDVFGLCACESGYEKTEQHLCTPAMVITIPDEGEGLKAMAQKGEGRMDYDNNYEGGGSSTYKPKGSEGLPTKEIRDQNVDVEVYPNVLPKIEKTYLQAKGGVDGNFTFSMYLLIFSEIVLMAFL